MRRYGPLLLGAHERAEQDDAGVVPPVVPEPSSRGRERPGHEVRPKARSCARRFASQGCSAPGSLDGFLERA